MLTIKIKFINGQYHANPWGRNVNEGVAEFPPSPYRIVRTIIDAWFRKRSEWELDELESIIKALASESPKFHISEYKEAFYKTYMSENTKDPADKQIIYDSFISINPDEPVLIMWNNVNLNSKELSDLNEILSTVNYLGRSNSWVEISLESNVEGMTWNVFPVDNNVIEESSHLEIIKIATPVRKEDYIFSLPWIEALELSTSDLIEKKTGSPYALKFEDYYMDNNKKNATSLTKTNNSYNDINTFVYSINTSVPPQITETIKISERLHTKLNGTYGKLFDKSSSETFSGRSSEGKILTGHRHLFILPIDQKESGRTDHILLRSKESFTDKELKVLGLVDSIWQSDRKPDIKLVPIEWGNELSVSFLVKSNKFKSVTPFIPTRHYRKGRGDFKNWLFKELSHELVNHGFPEPIDVALLKKLERKGHSYYWLDFLRNRKNDSSRIGYGFEITFKEDIIGPFSVGYGAHFGLGLFYPIKEIK